MVKVAISSTKYVIYGSFSIVGYIDKPDLIGSFFGQTEGLIGVSLEFQNLQKCGKIGRIDINLIKKNGRTKGKFTVPTALDRVEVSLVAAAIESINKIGHCSGEIKITDIKDEREDKRKLVMIRAEELLSNLKEKLPISSEITLDISDNVSKRDIMEYGNEIYGGPNIKTDEEIILVEGRADVLNLLKCGISNVLSINGSKYSNKITRLVSGKKIIAFLDDDKAGHAELDVLNDKLKLNYYCFPEKGKEVEDLNYKEVIKCLKNKIEIEKLNKKIDSPSIIDKIKSLVVSTVEEEEVIEPKKNIKIKKEELKVKSTKKIEDKQKIISKDVEKVDLVEKTCWSKAQFQKINYMIESVNGKNLFVVLNENYRRIKIDSISNIGLYSSDKGKILIIDGICEKSVLKIAKNNNIEFVISKSKSRIVDSSIKIKLFKEFD